MDPLVLLLACLLFTVFGVMAGVVTGLVPGIHVNNVALFVYVSQTSLSGIAFSLFGWACPSALDITLMLSALILATAVAHTFVSFVPSVFLGAPSEDTALSILPGHRMLLSGRGYEAVLLAARGCLWGFIASLALVLPLRLFMGSPVDAYDKLRPFMAGVLALVVTLLIYSESDRQVTTGRVKVKANEIGGVQFLGESGHVGRLEPWRDLVLGDEICLDGKMVKAWPSGFLLVKGKRWVKVVSHEDVEEMCGSWVRVQGFVLPETRVASALERRGWALLLFLLSGSLGWVLLTSPGLEAANWFLLPSLATSSPSMMLFPLFTGLFGLSTMIISGASRDVLPEQDVNPKVDMVPWRQARSVASGTVAGAAVSWFPGVSGASATVIARYLSGGNVEGEEKDNDREFLISIGAANAASTLFTIVALFVIMKGRSGASATIGAMLSNNLSPWEPLSVVPVTMAILLVSSFVAATMAFLMTVLLARISARKCVKMRYGLLVRMVILFLLLAVFLLTGALGLFVACTATLLGVLPPIIGIRRVHLMGCLILPAIILLAS